VVVWGASGWEVCLLSDLLGVGGMDELGVSGIFFFFLALFSGFKRGVFYGMNGDGVLEPS